MLTFNRNYFGLTVVLFVIELFIAMHVEDSFVRPYLGDVLVVILMYCFFRSFIRQSAFEIAMTVLFIAFAIEWLQLFHIVKLLGLESYTIARIVLGTTFAWFDLIAYTVGILIVLITEKHFPERTDLNEKRIFRKSTLYRKKDLGKE
ncbi:MAG: DUF2809 domain-containing protein [Fulvivirga sp.]|nr:DUF2809 domain-containing protein [Fulvivirga sp.]